MGVCIEERPVMHWQQSARYLGPSHDRNNASPNTANLTLLNPSSNCYQSSSFLEPNNSVLDRPSCLTCPTINEHCDHLPENNPINRPQYNHPNMPPHLHAGPATPTSLMHDRNMMLGQHSVYNESCQNFDHERSSSRDGITEESSNNFTDYYNDCKKESATTPNHLKNNNNNNNNNNNDIRGNILELKTEPICNPSSPESTSVDVPPSTGLEDCAGCGRLIQDRFYLSAVEKKWHAGCLQCCVCRQALEGATSCFSRDGNIYCKTDYYRIYAGRRCSKCLTSISSSELVMRAKHLVYHIRCFSCAICNQVLNKGDQFGIRSSAVYCRLHYETSLDSPSAYPCPYGQPNPYCDSPNDPPSSPSELTSLDGTGYYGGVPNMNPSTSGPSGVSMTGLPQQPRQKGRPRKRKPKDIDAMTANLDLNADYLDMGFSRGSLGGGSSRTKRMRTSFKHHQLRTMKSYFAINHNPDAKDLKQLSQKTGLPKRVLQVWFQNARAKWRRMMMKSEGKSIDSDKGEGSIDLDTYNPHSPSYLLGSASPTSMD